MAALLLATGCGSSGNEEITVQTGSLSKAAFIAKADAICKAARTEFLGKFSRFLKAHKSEITGAKNQQELLSELLESVLSPNIEGQIEQISELGAPSAYAPKVEAFLAALQKTLDEAEEKSSTFTESPFPFKAAEDVAKASGMQGCSESFS